MAFTSTTLTSLRHPWEFGRAYRQGHKVWNHAFVVYVLPTHDNAESDRQGWRYGVTATKKIGNAVQRNRGKRLVRESLRLSAELIRDGQDIVVVIRQRALTLKCPSAQRLLLDLLARAGALTSSAASASRRAAFARDSFARSNGHQVPQRAPATPRDLEADEASS